MHTRTVIRTIRWIQKQISDEIQFSLFPISRRKERARINEPIKFIHDVSRVAEVISGNSEAVEVLDAFDLSLLTDREKLLKRLSSLLGPPNPESDSQNEEERVTPHPSEEFDAISFQWHAMLSCASPLESITTPVEMRREQLPDTFITFTLASLPKETPLSRLAKATAFAEEAYESICRAYQTKGSISLTIVKVESGSSIRIDCKGLGDPIKHLKDLIIEAWHKLRHKRAEEVLENNKAVLSSLSVIAQINTNEKNNTISSEEAEQLRRKIITSVSGLFECGALIEEVPPEETVDNTKLLGGFVPKQLPAPKPESKTIDKKKKAKKAIPKKRRTRRKA